MKKTILFISIAFLNLEVYSQNVGVGIDLPTSKIHVVQMTPENAVKVDHKGTSKSAMVVNVGDPEAAPGPANTGNNFSSLKATHMGTGTGSLGSKSAVEAVVHGSDPAILAISNGNQERQGILSIANPNGFTDPQAVYGFANSQANAEFGIGVRGAGGLYGVHGIELGGAEFTFAVYGDGDYGGTGAKYFSIDHPLDPENKILNHYSIESNEVTNMYRGIVTLDQNGEAVVVLPDYFEATNINPSYQLTAIGTPKQPYVLVEVVNNRFTVAGAPNTKVSWTVYAKRNDATIRYFDARGKNYDQEVVTKPPRMKGKYLTPEAYGQPKSKGVHYDRNFERIKRKALAGKINYGN